MRTVKLTISYKGTNYVGWQRQPAGESIQQKLEEAISRILSHDVSITGAGRTDAGVHAVGQVAHFQTESEIPCDGIRRGANSMLPPDISIVGACDEIEGFHAKNGAVGKIYLYRIYVSSNRLPLEDPFAWHISTRLDLEAMREGAEKLVGRHDFESFRATGCCAKSSVRTINRIEIRRPSGFPFSDYSGAQFADLIFEGEGFLRHMVRNMTGALVEVGRGRMTPDDIARILLQKNRQERFECAPARGLCLVKVIYM